MPAIARPRSSRSLSPSLLSNAPHRYIPYHRINSTYSFGMRQPSGSPESYACDRMGKLNLAERCPQRPAFPVAQPARPSTQRTTPTHRRAVSLSSIPAQSQGYILLPQRRRRAAPQPIPIRIPSPPLTPIVESPIPVPTKDTQQQQQQLMLVSPNLAAYLKQGGSVSVRGADGKSWRVRAPIPIPTAATLVSPTFGMRMMRM